MAEQQEQSSFLSNLSATKGSIDRPWTGIFYGEGGCWKTGTASIAPDTFFLAVENGVDWVEDSLFFKETYIDEHGEQKQRAYVPKTSDEFFLMLRELCKKSYRQSLPHPIKTVVIDSLGFLQPLFYNDIVSKNPFTKASEPKEVKSIIDLGYDGMGMAMAYWNKLLTMCTVLNNKGINVLLITHSEKINNSTKDGRQYKEIGFALQRYGAYNVQELLSRHVDFVYFFDFETMTSTHGKGNRAKTMANGTTEANVVVSTRQTSLFYAKKREKKGKNTPDSYELNAENRDEVSKQIFNDLIVK